MPNRSRDWLRQAERDLAQAEDSAAAGRHEWACFACQQSAEKALKALHEFHSQEVWGHVVARLLRQLPCEVPDGLEDKAKVLDGYYIATRYANGHVEGAPYEHYGSLQSRQAMEYAVEILKFVRSQVAES